VIAALAASKKFCVDEMATSIPLASMPDESEYKWEKRTKKESASFVLFWLDSRPMLCKKGGVAD
jgi:hypothetical protein